MIAAAVFMLAGIISLGVAYTLEQQTVSGWCIAFYFSTVLLGVAVWETSVVYAEDGLWEAGTPGAYVILFLLGLVLLVARRPTPSAR
jgi:hypothetical protein